VAAKSPSPRINGASRNRTLDIVSSPRPSAARSRHFSYELRPGQGAPGGLTALSNTLPYQYQEDDYTFVAVAFTFFGLDSVGPWAIITTTTSEACKRLSASPSYRLP
jgi:hypothetical protein